MDKLKLISKPETPKPETQNKPGISAKLGVNLRIIRFKIVSKSNKLKNN